MLVKHINYSIPKRKRDEDSEKKHQYSTVRNDNRCQSCHDKQQDVIAKNLYADAESLKKVVVFEENQRRCHQQHWNPDDKKNQQIIINDIPEQCIDHK